MQQGGPWPCSQEVQGADGHAQEGEKGPIRRPDKRFSEGSHDRETTPQVRRPRRTAYSRTRPCHPWRVDGAGPTAAPSAAANGAGCERGSALRSRRRCGPSTDAHLGGSCGEYEYTPADRERKTEVSERAQPALGRRKRAEWRRVPKKRRKQNQDGSSPSAKAREAREAGAAWRPGKALAQLGRRGWARLGRERGKRPSRKEAKRCLCDAG